jgi:D-xylose transport system substrate-binding protein
MKNIGLVSLSLILSVLIGLSLAGSGSQPAENGGNKKLVIGFSLDTLKEARWIKDRDIFVAKAEELGAEVLVNSANSNDAAQLQNIDSLIAKNVDVLVIVPHDGAAMAKAVEKAHAKGIPVIAYDRLITGCDLDMYITFDNERVGELQAQYLISSLPKGQKSKIVRIYGAPTDNNAKLFKKGQDRVVDQAVKDGLVEVIHEDWADNWDPVNAKRIVNAAMASKGKDFAAILASNDGTAGGAIQALKEEDLAGKVIVTGQDADLVAVQRILAGTQHMTIYKPIKNIASSAAALAIKMAQGKPVIARSAVNNGKIDVPSLLLEVTTVQKDNVEETVVKDGFHTTEELGLSKDK